MTLAEKNGAHVAPAPCLVSRGMNLHRIEKIRETKGHRIGFLGIDSLYLLIEYPHADLYYKWAAISDKQPQTELKKGIPVGDLLIRRGAHGYGLSLWEGDARLYITTRVDEELRDTEQKGQGMGALLQLGPQALRQFGEVVKIGLKVPRMIRLKIPRTNGQNVGQLLLLSG